MLFSLKITFCFDVYTLSHFAMQIVQRLRAFPRLFPLPPALLLPAATLVFPDPHVKCSEMYLIVILNPKKTKASAEESPVGQMSCRPNHKCLVDRPNVLSAKCLSVKGPVGQTSVGLVSVGQMSGHAM